MGTFSQSARKAARPLSVSGCWKSCQKTLLGMVATSAPIWAASKTCSPRSPKCDVCPLRSDCRAFAQEEPERFPLKAARKRPTRVRAVAGLLVDPARGLLLARRPEEGLLGGLWEVPGGDWPERVSAAAALRQLWTDRIGVSVKVGEVLGEVEHIFTHRKLRLVVHEITEVRGEPQARGYPEVRWVSSETLTRLPLSRLTQKVLAAVGWRHE